VGSANVLVVWCQPVGLMQGVEWRGAWLSV